jgi:hypothetical protein
MKISEDFELLRALSVGETYSYDNNAEPGKAPSKTKLYFKVTNAIYLLNVHAQAQHFVLRLVDGKIVVTRISDGITSVEPPPKMDPVAAIALGREKLAQKHAAGLISPQSKKRTYVKHGLYAKKVASTSDDDNAQLVAILRRMGVLTDSFNDKIYYAIFVGDACMGVCNTEASAKQTMKLYKQARIEMMRGVGY